MREFIDVVSDTQGSMILHTGRIRDSDALAMFLNMFGCTGVQ